MCAAQTNGTYTHANCKADKNPDLMKNYESIAQIQGRRRRSVASMPYSNEAARASALSMHSSMFFHFKIHDHR